ncbi:MAG: Ig-like domain-containing protein [Pirellulaceae bacterium]
MFKVLPGTAVEGEDYRRMLPASLSFAAFEPEIPGETPPESESLFMVPLIDDLLAESAEEFSIELVPLHNAQLVRDRATAVIQRNDGQAPLAIDDAITTWEDTPVELDLLAPNPDQADSTPQGELDPASLQIVSPPSHGTLSANLDGTLLFTPAAEYFGTDSFTYQVSDTLGYRESNIATVTLEITEVDDPPMIQDVTFSIDENSPNGTIVGQLEIVDVDGGEPFNVVLSAGNLEGTFALNELHQIIVANSNHLDAEQITSFDLVVEVVVNETVTDSALVQVNVHDVADGHVVGRHIFYNNSAFDGNDGQANEADDLAIAPGPSDASLPELGKTALLPGQGPATFQNYTSYSRGINGVMVDIRDLATLPSIETWDQFFEFRVGNSSTPASWTSAPAPIDLLARPGAGVNGSTRITLVWADNAIQQQWLQVNVLQNNVTGLSQLDTHYWGNAIGETGTIVDATDVDGFDVIGIRDNATFFVFAQSDSRYDVNRDKNVDGFDVIIARDYATFFLRLALIRPQ